MANILAIGTTEASSSDFVVAAGTPNTICLVDSEGPGIGAGAFVSLQFKDANAQYFTVDYLQSERVARVLIGPGTYRVTRAATGVSCGVDLT